MATFALRSRWGLGPAVAVSFAALTAFPASPAVGQAPEGGAPPAATLAATTVPIPDAGKARWAFHGDMVIGLTEEAQGDKLIGHFNAYSLVEGKALWHVDQALGNKDQMGGKVTLQPSPKSTDWYIGKGPLSRLDLTTGTIKWSIPCETSGFVSLGYAKFLSGDRLLISGSKKCDAGSDYDAMKEPQFTMINAATGQVVWQYQTKSIEYETSLGYWTRVAKWQGKNGKPDRNRQYYWTLVTKRGGFDTNGIYEPDRVALAGEQWEVIRLSDGVSLVKTQEKPGILRGAYDGTVLFRDGDKLSAYTPAGANPIWTYDLKNKGVGMDTADDLIAKGYGVPDGMGDIIISESDFVSRVSIETGKAVWTLKLKGMRWDASKHAVLTTNNDKVFAYDWKSAAKVWETKVKGKPKAVDAGDNILLVAGGKYQDGVPQPPFSVTAVKGNGGQILWSRKDIDGKKITAWQLVGNQMLRLTNEKGTVANLKMTDGTPAEAALIAVAETPSGFSDDNEEGQPQQQKGFFMGYSEKKKVLQCYNFAGKLIWERKGESSMSPAYKMGKGCVVWASTDGTVEVIGIADGASLWKQKMDSKDPNPAVNKDGTYMVVQTKGDVTIVKLPGV